MFAGAAGSSIGRKLAPCPTRSNNLMARLICLARYSAGKVEASPAAQFELAQTSLYTKKTKETKNSVVRPRL